MRTLIVSSMAMAAFAGPAAAHGDEAHGLEPAWTFDPWIVIPLLLTGLLYGFGSVRLSLRARAGHYRSGHAFAFWTGWLALAGALVSPLHWLGEHLFTFHMIEHEIVMAAAAPLIVIARPVGLFFWALPRQGRQAMLRMFQALRGAWRTLTGGNVATLLHGLVIWVWHVPLLFDAAVSNTALHRLQHLSFFLAAILFWWSVLWVSDRGIAAWHLFVTMMHTSVLGALMALAPRVLYVAQTRTAADWGVTPLEDQQLAGIVMWVPAGTIYAGGALVLLALWISKSGTGAMHGRSIRSS
jgi:cytochrome c oxidase assembly factor CtaG